MSFTTGTAAIVEAMLYLQGHRETEAGNAYIVKIMCLLDILTYFTDPAQT